MAREGARHADQRLLLALDRPERSSSRHGCRSRWRFFQADLSFDVSRRWCSQRAAEPRGGAVAMLIRRLGVAASGLLAGSGLLALIGSAAVAAHAQDVSPEATIGEHLFRERCSLCHAVGAGAGGGQGPNLAGVLGRKAGSTEFCLLPRLENVRLDLGPRSPRSLSHESPRGRARHDDAGPGAGRRGAERPHRLSWDPQGARSGLPIGRDPGGSSG